MKPDRIQLTATKSPWTTSTTHVGEYVFATFADAARFVTVITGVIAGQSVGDVEITLRGDQVKVTIGPIRGELLNGAAHSLADLIDHLYDLMQQDLPPVETLA